MKAKVSRKLHMKSVILQPHIQTIKKFRVPCVGGCGTMVFRDQGECRDCRRARIHHGKKILFKLQRSQVYG